MNVKEAGKLEVGDIVMANNDGLSGGVEYLKGQLGLVASKEGVLFTVHLYEGCNTGIVFEENWDVVKFRSQPANVGNRSRRM